MPARPASVYPGDCTLALPVPHRPHDPPLQGLGPAGLCQTAIEGGGTTPDRNPCRSPGLATRSVGPQPHASGQATGPGIQPGLGHCRASEPGARPALVIRPGRQNPQGAIPARAGPECPADQSGGRVQSGGTTARPCCDHRRRCHHRRHHPPVGPSPENSWSERGSGLGVGAHTRLKRGC